MRTFTIILILVTLLLGAAVVYVVVTTPRTAEPIRFPLSAEHRALVARVPASADSFALLPRAVVLHAKLVANPVTRDAIEKWTARQPLPPRWIIGGADVVVWRAGKQTSYAISLDPFRAFLVKILGGVPGSAWDGNTLLVDAPATPHPPFAFDPLGVPEGHALIVQRDRARGAFPPIGRPAVTSVTITPQELLVVSRSVAGASSTQRPSAAGSFPEHAMFAVTFVEPPALLADLRRLLGVDIAPLIANGGSIALYEVDAGTLLPRPKGVIAIPATPESREALESVVQVAQMVGETRDTGSQLLVSFDRTSLGQYSMDTQVPASWPATRWQMRMDPGRLVPVLRRLGDSPGLRLAAPRVHRAARDLRKWIDALEQAKTVEAADSISGGVEELRVRIAAK